MGLDQYAYVVVPNKDNTDFYFNEDFSYKFCEWRKHPNLEGWMEKLFNQKADKAAFEGCIEKSGEVIIRTEQVPSDTEIPEGTSVVESIDEIQKAIKSEQELMVKTMLSKRRVFNNQPIRLTLTDLEQLETAILRKELPPTKGFFFGENADEQYYEQDHNFIEMARKFITIGAEVYYSSWW